MFDFFLFTEKINQSNHLNDKTTKSHLNHFLFYDYQEIKNVFNKKLILYFIDIPTYSNVLNF